MVDAERLHRLLGECSRRVHALDQRRQRGVPLDDEDALNSVKYLFVTAIEAAVDVAQHLVASEGWGAPATNAEAFSLLAANGVVSNALASAMAAANGFRNVLVHGYAEVDDSRVVAMLDRLGDLRAFCAAVAAWLTELTS